MSDLKINTKCCKPFPNKKCGKTLRSIIPWMQKKIPSLKLGQKICDTCRKSLHEFDGTHQFTNDSIEPYAKTEVDDFYAADVDANDDKNDERDSSYFSKDYIIELLDKFLLEIGEAFIEKKKLMQKKYCNAKIGEIISVLKNKIFVGYCCDEEEDDDPSVDILSQLKEKFQETTTRSEKMTILTLVPRHWSARKIESEFDGVTNHMVRMSKKLMKEKGILSSPNIKCGHPIPCETTNLIKSFYLSDEVSRVMPGKKDFVSVKTENGRIHEQKRLMLNNLRELYVLFKGQNPNVKVSFSKFATIRPKNCVLAGASGTHSVCVCVIHQNPILMLDACDLGSLEGNIFGFSDYASLQKHMICDNPTKLCYFSECENCPGAEKVKDTLLDLFEDNGIETVTYQQWTTTDRADLVTVVDYADEFIESLIDKLIALLRHSFIAKQQSEYLKFLKETIERFIFIIICDFAENYSFVVQNEVQRFHWNNTQATIHPFAFYYKNELGQLDNGNLVVISDCLKHDTVAVHLFQKHCMKFLSEKYQPAAIKYFSDGCAGQYKNRKNFLNLTYHKHDFELPAEWHFFATSHGKNASDGLGGTVKRLAAKASLQRPLHDQILTPEQLFQWAKSNITGINFVYVSNDEYLLHEKIMNERFTDTKLLVGTRKQHALFPVEPGVLKAKTYSFETEVKEHFLKK